MAGRVATGRRAGQRVVRVDDCIDPEDLPALEGERCASVSGVSLHANVAVPARDHRRLERLCRYAARPPVATERLSRLEDGRLLYRLKHRWRDGTTTSSSSPRSSSRSSRPVSRRPVPTWSATTGSWARARASATASCRARAKHGSRRRFVRRRGIRLTISRSSHTVRRKDRAASEPRFPIDAARWPGGEPNDPEALRSRGARGRHPTSRPSASGGWPGPISCGGSSRSIDVLECPRCGGRMRLLAAIQPPDVGRVSGRSSPRGISQRPSCVSHACGTQVGVSTRCSPAAGV